MEKIVLFLFLNVFSSLADVWCFFKISRIRSKKRQILFLCIANIFLGLLLSIGNIGVIFTNILEILLFVLYLRKNNTLEILFGSIIWCKRFALNIYDRDAHRRNIGIS